MLAGGTALSPAGGRHNGSLKGGTVHGDNYK
jgi:hypothetical protein